MKYLFAILLANIATPGGPIVRDGRVGGAAGGVALTPSALGSPCVCSTPTFPGGSLVLTRSTPASCQIGSDQNAAPGSLVGCAANQMRIESPGGSQAIRLDTASTNQLVRSEEFENAAWTTVGAGTTVTANTLVAPDNATTGDSISDSDAATIAGVTQTYAAVQTGFFAASVFVRAGTASVATLTVQVVGGGTGTATCISGTLTANWTRLKCIVNITAAGTGISLFVGVGSGVGTTGTIGVFGAQLESALPFATAYIQSVSSATARGADNLTLNITGGVGPVGSYSVGYRPLHGANTGSCGQNCGGPIAFSNANSRPLNPQDPNVAFILPSGLQPGVAANWVADTVKTYCTRWSVANGAVIRNVTDSLSNSTAFSLPGWGSSDMILSGNTRPFISGHYSNLRFSATEGECP